MDSESQEYEIIVKDLRKDYEKAVQSGKKHMKYKGLKFYTEYVKYLLEHVEGQKKDSFRITKASLPKK